MKYNLQFCFNLRMIFALTSTKHVGSGYIYADGYIYTLPILSYRWWGVGSGWDLGRFIHIQFVPTQHPIFTPGPDTR